MPDNSDDFDPIFEKYRKKAKEKKSWEEDPLERVRGEDGDFRPDESDEIFERYRSGEGWFRMPPRIERGKDFRFTVSRVEKRSKRIIIEGNADVTGRTYYDELSFHVVIGPGYLKLDTMRDFDGERLIEHYTQHFGPPSRGPDVEVGGSMDEENSAYLVVEWLFDRDQRDEILDKLWTCIGQRLDV